MHVDSALLIHPGPSQRRGEYKCQLMFPWSRSHTPKMQPTFHQTQLEPPTINELKTLAAFSQAKVQLQ